MTAMQTSAALTEWQRLSPWAVVFLFVRGAVRFARENIPLLVGVGAGAAYVEAIGVTETLLGVGVLLLIGGLIALQYYQRFRFRLDGDVLLVQKGLIERIEIKVSADRVQHTAVDQPAYMRPFNVVRFSVDTPGGITTEVELPGIPRPFADILRQVLGTGAAAGDAEAPATERLLYRVTPGGLTLHGLASNHAYVLAAVAAPIMQPLERLARERLREPGNLEWLQPVLDRPLLTVASGIPSLLLALILASVTFAWLRFYGFRLIQDQDRFIQYSGFLTQREQTLNASKLQSVEWVQTAVGRLLGCGHLICRQYGGLPRGAEQAGSSFLIPGVRVAQAPSLRAVFWPGLTAIPPLQAVDRYYRRVMALRLGLAGAALLGLMALLALEPLWLWGLVPLPIVTWVLGHLRWRAVGWQQQGRYLAVRRGLLGSRTSYFPLENVQTASVRQSWFQRRRGLATLELALASGPETIPFIPLATARRLANEGLYRVERLAAPPADRLSP